MWCGEEMKKRWCSDGDSDDGEMMVEMMVCRISGVEIENVVVKK